MLRWQADLQERCRELARELVEAPVFQRIFNKQEQEDQRLEKEATLYAFAVGAVYALHKAYKSEYHKNPSTSLKVAAMA